MRNRIIINAIISKHHQLFLMKNRVIYSKINVITFEYIENVIILISKSIIIFFRKNQFFQISSIVNIIIN